MTAMSSELPGAISLATARSALSSKPVSRIFAPIPPAAAPTAAEASNAGGKSMPTIPPINAPLPMPVVPLRSADSVNSTPPSLFFSTTAALSSQISQSWWACRKLSRALAAPSWVSNAAHTRDCGHSVIAPLSVVDMISSLWPVGLIQSVRETRNRDAGIYASRSFSRVTTCLRGDPLCRRACPHGVPASYRSALSGSPPLVTCSPSLARRRAVLPVSWWHQSRPRLVLCLDDAAGVGGAHAPKWRGNGVFGPIMDDRRAPRTAEFKLAYFHEGAEFSLVAMGKDWQ